MKSGFAILATAAFGVLSAAGQQTAPAPSGGPTVIFSRSQAEVPESTASVAPAKSPMAAVSDAERRAVAILSYDLEIHLQLQPESMSVRARMNVRNNGPVPLRQIPLQVSSSLTWESVRIAGESAAFASHPVASDADHTGSLDEAVISLPQPLPAGNSVAVDATYSGKVPPSTARLERIGAPAERAKSADWDHLSGDFVGLRGFGNVVWYPVASVPVLLGDGNRLFTEINEQRQRQSHATVTMRVTAEFFGPAPNLAVLNGRIFALQPDSLPSIAGVPGIVTAVLPRSRSGFVPLTLFLLRRTPIESAGVRIYALPEDDGLASEYAVAATTVRPLLEHWLGNHPAREFSIIDLPDSDDFSFEDGPVLFTGMQSLDPEKLERMLVLPMAHAYFESPYLWLDEGVASFMTTLWLEQTRGRVLAIRALNSDRAALALAEPGDPPSGAAGESLVLAKDPVYYRQKATYVFWMLRDLAGDSSLSRAFAAYKPAEDPEGKAFERVLEAASGKNLSWFFHDWVYNDLGLPDFAIAGVYPDKAATPGAYIVAVQIRNSGGAEAEVPVSVRSGETTVTERLRVSANSRVTHRFLVQGRPDEVAVNDGTVPEVEASVHRETLDSQTNKE